MFDSGAIAWQISFGEVTKRPLRLTTRPDTKYAAVEFVRLKLIGEELWLCHYEGITVYDCQSSKLREIRIGRLTRSVAALDTKTVVVATYGSLVMSSTSGIKVRGVYVRVCMLCRLYFWLRKSLHYDAPCKTFKK